MLPWMQVDSLQASLDRILDSKALLGALVSAYVCKLDGTQLYSRNAAIRLMPGSNQKLLSVAFALDSLGPEHRWTTRIWKLADRVVIDAPGDPSLSFAQLKDAAGALAGPTNLPVFVRQAYGVGVPPTWEYGDLSNRFAPRIAAFSFDRAALQLYAVNGKPALFPMDAGIRIIHFPWGERSASLDPFGNVLVVHGEFPSERTLIANLAMPWPDRVAASLFGSRLMEAHEVPSSNPAVEIRGKSVGDIARECMVPSDNFLAEHLFLQGALNEGPFKGAPYEESASRMKAFLERKVGIGPADMRPVDGSGVSRHNLATTRGIGRLLVWAAGQSWGRIFRSSLAAPGHGTLESRLRGIEFQGKTGTLDTVSALSGFVKSRSGDTVVVSLMVNHYACSASEARAVLDGFVRQLAGDTGTGTVVVLKGKRESGFSEPRDRAAHAHRVRGPDHNLGASSAGGHRRAQSPHAPLARKRRMALRPRKIRDLGDDLGVSLRIR